MLEANLVIKLKECLVLEKCFQSALIHGGDTLAYSDGYVL